MELYIKVFSFIFICERKINKEIVPIMINGEFLSKNNGDVMPTLFVMTFSFLEYT